MLNPWQKMEEITRPICAAGIDECAKFAHLKHRCCQSRYCEEAAKLAKDKHGIDLPVTGNKDLPFMGDNGCVVPPEMRPVCTIHVCSISWAGKSHIGHDTIKTREYFELRRRLERVS